MDGERALLLHDARLLVHFFSWVSLNINFIGQITASIKRRISVQGVPVGPVLIGDSRSVALILPLPLSVHRITLAQVHVIIWAGRGIP